VPARVLIPLPARDFDPSEGDVMMTRTIGLERDSTNNETPAFVVRDRNYVSARWPGEAHTFAKK
jgi:hypothetical protein